MRRILFAIVLISSALAAQAVPSQGSADAAPKPQATAPQRKIPCKTPENASICYWTHGRLYVTEGWVRWKIWKVGTKRILFVYSGPSAFPERTEEDRTAPELPANLDRAYEAEAPRMERENRLFPDWVYADFEVCPLEPEKTGEAQAVCVESAKNIVFDRSKKMYQ